MSLESLETADILSVRRTVEWDSSVGAAEAIMWLCSGFVSYIYPSGRGVFTGSRPVVPSVALLVPTDILL